MKWKIEAEMGEQGRKFRKHPFKKQMYNSTGFSSSSSAFVAACEDAVGVDRCGFQAQRAAFSGCAYFLMFSEGGVGGEGAVHTVMTA